MSESMGAPGQEPNQAETKRDSIVTIRPDRSVDIHAPLSIAKEKLPEIRREFVNRIIRLSQTEARLIEHFMKGGSSEEAKHIVSAVDDTEDAKLLEESVSRLEDSRIRMAEIYAKYKDDNDLFKYLFGFISPDVVAAGGYEIDRLPLFPYIRCTNPVLYSLAHNGEHDTSKPLSDADLWVSKVTGGFMTSSESTHIPVAFENDTNTTDHTPGSRTLVHEASHVINKSLMLEIVYKGWGFHLKEATDENNIELANIATGHLLSHEFELVSSRAADEIISYMLSDRDSESINTILSKKKEDGGLYDYTNKTNRRFSELKAKFEQYGGETLYIFEQNYENIMSHDRLVEAITKGTESIERLRSRGFSDDEIAPICRSIPLNRWPRITETIAETKFFELQYFDMIQGPVVALLPNRGLVTGELTTDYSKDGFLFFDTKASDGSDVRIRINPEQKGLEELNYPFKTISDWLSIWNMLEDVPLSEDELDIESKFGGLFSSLDFWVAVKKAQGIMNISDNTKEVFGTYRRHLRNTQLREDTKEERERRRKNPWSNI